MYIKKLRDRKEERHTGRKKNYRNSERIMTEAVIQRKRIKNNSYILLHIREAVMF